MDKKFIAKVENYIEKNHLLSVNDYVVIGVSGGADSVALFLLLCELKSKYNLTLSVVHVNHGLRAQALEEAQYVESLCKAYDVDFNLFSFDVKEESKKRQLGTEETGRLLRYSAFEKLAGKKGKIAIAHNLNDRCETMLFHLCRGTGPKGLAAIKAVNDNRIRPLLCVTRSEIEAFLNQAGVKYYIDKSNLENDYTRNKIRNQVFPILTEEINSEALRHFAKTSELIEDQNDFINQVAKEELKKATTGKADDSIIISRKALNGLHITVKRELVKLLIDYMVPFNKDITQIHIESIIELSQKEGNYSLNLPYEMEADFEYDYLKLSFVYMAKEGEKVSYKLLEGEQFITGLGRVNVRVFDKNEDFILLQKEYTKYFDYDKIKCCLELRNRSEGDYLTVNSNMGKKKLKDYFIDNKVPKEEREKCFLLADGSHIMWVIGSRISEYYKVTEETKKIISVEIIREDL